MDKKELLSIRRDENNAIRYNVKSHIDLSEDLIVKRDLAWLVEFTLLTELLGPI